MENTELHSTLVYIEEKEFMSDLYPEGLPTNTIIDKTLTAKGATTCELEAKRNSIIVEPNVPVIVGKQNKYPKTLGVCEGVTDATIKAYLLDKSIPHKKIIVTPESYSKVKRAAAYASVNLFKNFFLLIDECEKVVQDAEFRPDIILPFFDFFSFDNKALISATPLFPNLKGFTNHSFTCIKIIPNYDYKKALNLVGTNNVQQEFMNQISQSGNKIAIFLNSPEYAKALIEKANIRNCTKIYCSDTDGNIGKLRKEGYKAADQFVSGEVLEQYSFFTSRFYSAVDLETSDRPDIIMMTDCISRPHTMIDPYTHAIQIIGRFRNGIGNITHVTNWNNDLKLQSREEIIKEMKAQKKVYDTLADVKEALKGRERELLTEIQERIPVYRLLFKNDEYKGKVNPFLVECYIQKFKIASFYQYPRYLENAYRETGHFNVSYHYEHYNDEHCNDEQPQTVKPKVLSRKRKIEILERLQVLRPKGLVFMIPSEEQEQELASLRYEAPELCKYYEKFGIDKIVEIDYDLSTMKRELKTKHKAEIYLVPIDEIYNTIVLGKPYSESEIIATLQMIYDKYNLVDDNNKPLKAKATYLNKYFRISERITIPKSRLKGYIPFEKKYSLE